jgi:electron transfer flavoprotein alpha subunit
MGNVVLVVMEQRDGRVRRVALEALHAAQTCADAETRIAGLLIGSGVRAQAGSLAAYPWSEIHIADHPELEHYNPEHYFAVVHRLVEQLQPGMIWFGHTAMGRDLAPRLAARLQAGQISDITAVERSGGEILFKRPIYAGKAFETRRLTRTPGVITVRPNNFPAEEPNGAAQAAPLIEIPFTPAPDLRTVVRDVVRKTRGRVDLSEARIVVAGGRGVQSAAGFKPLEELAAVLGAAVGASRAACDAGYCDYALQIGQTGKTVTPEVYIACGISGAIQHLAGMSRSRIIIAINKDPEAPIFKVADYGIVGDLFEVVPLLTEALKQQA